MAESGLIEMPKATPTEVILRTDEMQVAFTPRELRMIREACGRPWSQIVSDTDDDSDNFKVIAWLKLRREGYDPSFDDMDDVLIRITGETLDPTNGARSTISPPSAVTGE